MENILGEPTIVTVENCPRNYYELQKLDKDDLWHLYTSLLAYAPEDWTNRPTKKSAKDQIASVVSDLLKTRDARAQNDKIETLKTRFSKSVEFLFQDWNIAKAFRHSLTDQFQLQDAEIRGDKLVLFFQPSDLFWKSVVQKVDVEVEGAVGKWVVSSEAYYQGFLRGVNQPRAESLGEAFKDTMYNVLMTPPSLRGYHRG